MKFFDFRKNVKKRPAAAALHYDPQLPEPPQVIAVGRGVTAEEIVRIAKEHNIPLHEDAGLVEALARLDVAEYVPRELYTVVAEILAYVYRVDSEMKGRAS
jgi:flagellar biosynthesis protein